MNTPIHKGKVLHLVKTVNGATWAYRQIQVLLKEGWDIRVVVPSLEGPLPELLESIGVRMYECDLNLRKIMTSGKRLEEIVRQWKPDLIHSHFVVTTYAMRVFLRNIRVPRVFQVPGPLHLEGGPYGRIELALSDPSDYWIASCRWTRKKYRSLDISAERVFMSHYGTDTTVFSGTEPESMTFREEMGISEETPLVGMVAYMYPPKLHAGQIRGLKGHEDFIRAVSMLKRKIPNLRALIVGEQWGGGSAYERKLQKMAERECEDTVIFAGFRKDVAHIYRSLDVAVHPSHSENLGGASESMLMGVPTISTDVGGFPDIVKDGETGWLVKPKSPKQLADTILDVLDQPQESARVAENGCRYAQKLLDVNRTGREVSMIYSRILSKEED